MSEPRVTLVIPTLNAARFLPEALASVRAQTLDSWECRIVDGGSADATLDIARDYAARDTRFIVESHPGQGLYPAVIAGLDAARGGICGWLGADDLLAPWAFASVSDFMARTKARWAGGLPGAWDAQGRLRATRLAAWRPRRLIAAGWFHEELLGFIQQESVFFARELYASLTMEEKSRFAEARYAGDYLLWRMFARRERLAVLPAFLAGFRIHGANLSARKLDDYMAEVRDSGAPNPPARLGRRIGQCFETLAALMTLRAQRRALGALSAETKT